MLLLTKTYLLSLVKFLLVLFATSAYCNVSAMGMDSEYDFLGIHLGITLQELNKITSANNNHLMYNAEDKVINGKLEYDSTDSEIKLVRVPKIIINQDSIEDVLFEFINDTLFSIKAIMFNATNINDSMMKTFTNKHGNTPIQRSLFFLDWVTGHSVWYNSKEYLSLQTSSHPLQHSFQLSRFRSELKASRIKSIEDMKVYIVNDSVYSESYNIFQNEDKDIHLLRHIRGIELNGNSDDIVVQVSNVSNPILPQYELKTSVRESLFIPVDLFKYIIHNSNGKVLTIEIAIKHSNRTYLKETFRFIID